MLISPDYAEANASLHATNPRYGAFGSRWADTVRALAERSGSRDLLDYGCGKGSLANALADLEVHEYDPGVPGKEALPGPADLVVCTDVLEHIEPTCIEEVLAHIASLARRAAFLNISTRPAAKSLADGRNAHLIVQDADWWRGMVDKVFEVDDWQVEADQVNCAVRPRPAPPDAAPDAMMELGPDAMADGPA